MTLKKEPRKKSVKVLTQSKKTDRNLFGGIDELSDLSGTVWSSQLPENHPEEALADVTD